MFDEKILDRVVTGAISLLASLLTYYLKGIYPLYILLILAIFLFISFHVIYGMLKRSNFFRKVFDPLSPIEGWWYERVIGEDLHPDSIAHIKRTKSGNILYEGTNFNKDGTVNATWKSTGSINIDETGDMTFLFRATLFKGIDIKQTTGIGQLDFRKYCLESENKFCEGMGIVFDTGVESKVYRLILYRITQQDIKDVTGKDMHYLPGGLEGYEEKILKHIRNRVERNE